MGPGEAQQAEASGGGSTHVSRSKPQYQGTPAGMASPELLTVSGVNPKPYIPPPQRTPNSNPKACVWNHNETNDLVLATGTAPKQNKVSKIYWL